MTNGLSCWAVVSTININKFLRYLLGYLSHRLGGPVPCLWCRVLILFLTSTVVDIGEEYDFPVSAQRPVHWHHVAKNALPGASFRACSAVLITTLLLGMITP
jgi:hypothetical protein